MADDQVKRVKEASDIVDVIGSYLALRSAGPTFKGLCPFHDDSRPSFDVDPRRQRYRCWSCGKYGDVISFVQEHERVSFAEALELLARRAGISLENRQASPHAQSRALMLDVCCWAAQQYHQCLLDSPLAEPARIYLGQRGLLGETVRRYQLGFAPGAGDWLARRAEEAGIAREVLEKVGLIARRATGSGYYDRFRDRVQFPIRDVRGQVVGFGGRILPGSPLAARAAKYYNSSDTPLFSKSELLYGLDVARQAASTTGYLAVVEGYTDVLMAHQAGILSVVATMGTALNARHVQNLRRFASKRVILVFDADAGGQTGVDRALGLFASLDVDLAIATLPAGQDPCDLLVSQGAEAFRNVLEGAVDALEFKLRQVLGGQAQLSIEAQRQAVDVVLGIIALAPEIPGQAGAVKTQLMITRIAQRLALREETVWARLQELRQRRKPAEPGELAGGAEARQAPAAPEERELLELLLGEPDMVSRVRKLLHPEQIVHPGLRQLLQGLYALYDGGEPPTLDLLRPRLDNVRLAAKALELQDIGRRSRDKEGWLAQILRCFQERRSKAVREELQSQLQAASDHQTGLELLRRLQERLADPDPGNSSVANAT